MDISKYKYCGHCGKPMEKRIPQIYVSYNRLTGERQEVSCVYWACQASYDVIMDSVKDDPEHDSWYLDDSSR